MPHLIAPHEKHYHLYARTAMKRPTRSYRFRELANAEAFVRRFLKRHAKGVNVDLVWSHISQGDIAHVPTRFLLNFGTNHEVPPEFYPPLHKPLKVHD